MAINSSGILPTGGHILILPELVEEKTAGGIILPKTTQDKEQQAATVGKVVAIGPSAWKDLDDGLPWCQVGDKVSYARYAGIGMTGQDAQKYVLTNDNDILSVLMF